MDIRVTVTWDPEVDFEHAENLHVVTRLKNGRSLTFETHIRKSGFIHSYLSHLLFYASNHKEFETPDPNEEVLGVRGKEFLDLQEQVESFSRMYYIAPRKEEVSYEEYYAFYGNASAFGDPEPKVYPRGSVVEMLRQTVYDMNHRYPTIYKWTNVPRMYSLEDMEKDDPRFAEFSQKTLRPMIDNFYYSGAAQHERMDEVKRFYTLLADTIEGFTLRPHGKEGDKW